MVPPKALLRVALFWFAMTAVIGVVAACCQDLVPTTPPKLAPLYWTAIALHVADASSTYAGLSTGGTREANPFLPSNRNANLALQASYVATDMWIVRWMETHGHPRRAKWALVVSIVAESVAVSWNVRVLHQLHQQGF